MKKVTFVLAAMLLLLSGCNGAPTAAVSSDTSSIASSENISSRASSQPSSELVSSDEASSEAPSSEVEMASPEIPASSQSAASSEPSQPLIIPASSEESQGQSSSSAAPVKQEQVSSQEILIPASSEQDASDGSLPEYDPNKPISPTNIPPERRPMTEDEVDALIAEAIAYAEEKYDMIWYEDFSIDRSGYDPPAYSDGGYKSCKKTLLYNIDCHYQRALNDNYYTVGDPIAYKLVKGTIGQDPGWYIYLLY